MLKSRLTAEEWNALSDTEKAHYKLVNGKYVLDTDEANELRESAAAARRERDQLQERLTQIEADIQAARDAEAAAQAEAARKAKDLPAIEASWQAKLDEAKKKADENAERLSKMLRDLLIENKAQALANDISTSPKLILPHIRARLAAEIEGEAGITRVLDKDGKPSAMSLDDLKAEFVANTDFASIIKGSNGGGSGATNQQPGGSGATSKKFSELTEAERVALHRTNPDEYRRLRDAA